MSKLSTHQIREYPTIKAAVDRLALDTGFNPFLHHGVIDATGKTWTRPTRAALKAIGYPVADKRRA
jgi:hypothetical protein